MNGALQLGPLALPLPPLLLLLAAMAGLWVGRRAGRRADVDPEPALWRMLLLGLVAARLSFVWVWREAYLAQPWSVLDIRDGGFDPAIGWAAAALYAVAAVRRQPALRRALAAGGLATLALWSAGSVWLWSQQAQRTPLPALSLARLEGGSVDLRSYAGKPTVLNLWATWCPPCRREMPLLQRAQAAHPQVNFVFVNQGETAEAVRGYLQQQGLPLQQVLLDPSMRAGAVFQQRGLPTTLFFDAEGRLVSSRMGELSEAVLAQRMQRLR
ncbi:MAG: TlpA disulfide reductase family protein [Pseudomonadota bacterium]